MAGAVVAGAVLGSFQIANTSVGWHLASGRWILEHCTFLRFDPFSLTSGGVPWIDHEWLFQVGAACVHAAGGPTLLVVMRALAVALVTVTLLLVGVRSGLSPAAALLLAVLCVTGARPRFFLRPELVTLVVVPVAVWLFLERARRRPASWLALLAGLMVIGANSHGGALVVPILLISIVIAEAAQMVLGGTWNRHEFATGVAGVAVSTLTLLINPYGWRLFAVPIHLAGLVDQAHIPNPEWISPSFADTPALYIAAVAAVVLMTLRERRAARWALLLVAAALTQRHVRNIGLFFVLLPLAVAPALASWRVFAAETGGNKIRGRRADWLAVVAVVVLAASVATAPWPRFGFGYADNYYPDRACSFLDEEGLPLGQLYNDVRFGGYLIDRYGPERQVFQDDRNEIHDHLLLEIWTIFQASDVAAWSDLLARYRADTALVRYHPPVNVTDPAGNDLGERGFSALWFPDHDWAMVYWDDVAMVFVRRDPDHQDVIARHEYRIIRPDDLGGLERQLAEHPELRRLAAEELARALRGNPAGQRASEILQLLR
jgi:hypothetical protein